MERWRRKVSTRAVALVVGLGTVNAVLLLVGRGPDTLPVSPDMQKHMGKYETRDAPPVSETSGPGIDALIHPDRPPEAPSDDIAEGDAEPVEEGPAEETVAAAPPAEEVQDKGPKLSTEQRHAAQLLNMLGHLFRLVGRFHNESVQSITKQDL